MHHDKVLTKVLPGVGVEYNFTGTWMNELGSKVVLSQAGDKITGTYESAVSGGGTRTTGDLIGYANGDLIAFTVHWREYQAITAWVGQINPDVLNGTIATLWQMTNQVEPGDEWASINAGADTFTRT